MPRAIVEDISVGSIRSVCKWIGRPRILPLEEESNFGSDGSNIMEKRWLCFCKVLQIYTAEGWQDTHWTWEYHYGE